jgi:sortase B
MKRIKRPLWLVVLIFSLIVLLGGAVFLFIYLTQDDRPISRDDITVTETATEASAEEATAAPETLEPPTQAPTVNTFGYRMDDYDDWGELSFDELTKINPDIYAWIYIPDTKIDYPVAQSLRGDDAFYLSHNVYGEYQFSGTIYSESMNSRDFDDPVTVLYGHNMLNGSMFATLHYFNDADFFDEHTTCFVITKDKVLTYLIYAAYVYDDRHILNANNNFADEDVLLAYFDSTLHPRTYNMNVRGDVTLDKNSKVLTLSTCIGSDPTRYLVQGVLVNEQDRE